MSVAVQLQLQVCNDLTCQKYDKGCSIGGVTYRPLKKHRTDNGSFMEYMRLTDGVSDGGFSVRQINFVTAAPFRMNAFHVHYKEYQQDVWCAVAGQFEVWLVDVRYNYPLVYKKFLLTSEEPALLTIPCGVAHGFRAGPEGGSLLYVMDNQFNSEDPNEGRLPWDYFGPGLWDEDKG